MAQYNKAKELIKKLNNVLLGLINMHKLFMTNYVVECRTP